MKRTLFVLLFLLASSCTRVDVAELRSYKIVKIHYYGDTVGKTGWMHERFTHAIYEDIESGERLPSSSILGNVGDTLKTYRNTLE